MIDAHQLSCTCAAPFPTKQNPNKTLTKPSPVKPHTLSATVTQKMAWRSAGSLSRSLVSTARVSSLRSAPPLRRLRPPTVSTPRRLLFASPRNLGELGCIQSLLPMHSATAATCLTSHLAVNARGCCELSHGT
ncbi:protein NUCLEAR FUSION DEFECTIVE 6, chloroplastic/mitochondrial [Prunus avium]|uniref:Protein NUCLEAR FUSION DEFECTIVE 6, chloroplastic/mitochondrial n=1 Tax=Prunus avium TaxID=42229 RepID=A0A6P5TJU2_PRUAV|nr:protein NUCLEAR FUSION DEFECTIVE 6, chloroplastic/mitochondrial [Prunus avium]